MEATIPIITAATGAFLLVLGAILDDRRARLRRKTPAKLELPLLHSINDDRCIGCEACADACPTNVLEIVDHKVRVVRFKDCVQCEQCAHACPTTALVMYRQGQTPQTLTVPQLDDHFQTAVPGQYLIGEVAGKPLVKNAANLGRAVIEHIARSLPPRSAEIASEILDVVIVGSGPGGLSAGLTCIKRALACVVLDKEHVMASTVARYPKGKHFMAEPSHVKNLSYLPVFDGSKEDLVAAWQRVAEGAHLPIKLGEAVETVKRGDDGIFDVKTTVATYRARAVVLATGLRGKPRLLAVPGANLEKVQSLLDDPSAFGGEHVLVVGGGDSAVEGAMALADAGATVTLSYRGEGFKRCKPANQKRLAELASAGKLATELESNVTEFTPDAVSIKLKGGQITTIPNQRAFVLIGADTPVAWLETNNVRFVEREHLYALGSTEDVVIGVVPEATECSRSPDEALAIVLGKPPKRRLRTAVEEVITSVTGVFDEVITSVSGVFHLPTAAPEPRRAASRPALESSPIRTPSLPPPIPVRAKPRALSPAVARHVQMRQPPTEFSLEHTIVDAIPMFEHEHTHVERRARRGSTRVTPATQIPFAPRDLPPPMSPVAEPQHELGDDVPTTVISLTGRRQFRRAAG